MHHAKNLLAVEGIRATVRNEILSSAMGELPPIECQAELWVPARDAARAEELLFKSHPAGPPWACACGETLEGQFSHCWKCGAERA